MTSRARVPHYLQIAERLRARATVPGARLPSEHALCARYGVTRPTIRQALDLLVQEGRLSRHRGRGTFVSAVGEHEGRRLRVIGSVEDMLALGDETWFKVLARGPVTPPPAVARALKTESGAAVWRVNGVRHGDDGPFQHVTAFVPATMGEMLAEEDLTKSSVIGTLERVLGAPVKFLEQTIDVARGPSEVTELLEVPRRTPLLLFRRTYFREDGTPLEHAVTYQHGARYPYRVVLYRTGRRT